MSEDKTALNRRVRRRGVPSTRKHQHDRTAGRRSDEAVAGGRPAPHKPQNQAQYSAGRNQSFHSQHGNQNHAEPDRGGGPGQKNRPGPPRPRPRQSLPPHANAGYSGYPSQSVKRRRSNPSPPDSPPKRSSNEPIFDLISQVGQGTYGKVFKARNTESGQLLAMKMLKIDNENEGFPVTAAREIKLLQALHHENIVRIEEMVVLKGDIYIALDYIEHDLAGVLLNQDLVIQPCHAKSLVQQTLNALAYLHGQHILHRDIKGSNLLITANGVVKLADFGLARKLDPTLPFQRLTNRVITMWYRPPELLLGAENYGGEVDIWGVGCLLVEIFKKQPLFYGKDEVSQLQAVYNIMGPPSRVSWPDYVDLPWYYLIESMGGVGFNNAVYQFDKVFTGPEITPSCFNLAHQLLKLNPKNRISAADALQHEYFSEEPAAQVLDLRIHQEWHDWEAKQRKR